MKDRYYYNPFAGIMEDDIQDIIVPRFDVNDLILNIKSKRSISVEFVGKQGRGKTTHLTFLHQQMNNFPVYYLDSNSTLSDILNDDSTTVFVDSIHHLSFRERIQLFKSDKNIIYTTHWQKRLENLVSKRRPYRIQFNGIKAKTLKDILNKRLKNASKVYLEKEDEFTLDDAHVLIIRFKDDYRGIINHLFAKYQQ